MHIDDYFNSLGAYYYMINKCYDPQHRRYGTFGAKGATVCAAWRADRDLFTRDMGPPPTEAHYVKCKNDALPFAPDNCYWHANPTYVKRTPAEKKEAKAAASAAMEANRQRMMVLSDDDVKDILRMVHKEGMTTEHMTLLYPVSISLIRGIVSGARRRVPGYRYGAQAKRPRGKKSALTPALVAEIKAFREGGASIAEVATRFDISESYAYKLLPGPEAVARENKRLADAAFAQRQHALKVLNTPPAERARVPVDLATTREAARQAAKKREFDARVAALLVADLL